MTDENAEYQMDLDVSGAELLTAIWSALMATQAKKKQLATDPDFVTALTGNAAFCKAITDKASTAANKAVGQTMGGS